MAELTREQKIANVRNNISEGQKRITEINTFLLKAQGVLEYLLAEQKKEDDAKMAEVEAEKAKEPVPDEVA